MSEKMKYGYIGRPVTEKEAELISEFFAKKGISLYPALDRIFAGDFDTLEKDIQWLFAEKFYRTNTPFKERILTLDLPEDIHNTLVKKLTYKKDADGLFIVPHVGLLHIIKIEDYE